MSSLLALPDEILDIIAGYFDATSLSYWACANTRLNSSATRCTTHLKVPWVTSQLLDLLKQRVQTVRSLDLSNCGSASVSILALIHKCRFIRELNVVNSKLSFAQLANAVASLTELEILSCCYLDKCQNLAQRRRELPIFRGSPSIRNMYVELALSWPSIYHFASFLNKCTGLERLHIHLVGTHPSCAPSEPNSLSLVEVSMWQHLNTVIVSSCTPSKGFFHVFLFYLFHTRPDPVRCDGWRSEEYACFIYENGNTSTLHTNDLNSVETTVLKDAYHVQFESHRAEQMSFPWGKPRGLRIDCKSPGAARRAATIFLAPTTWSSDLVELDLTGCLPDLPGEAEWSNLIESSPAIEAIAIPFCFLPPQEMAECSRNSRQSKRQRTQYIFLNFLTSIRLRRLFVTGDCPHPRGSLVSVNGHHRSPDFSGIDKLAYLEELTLHNVVASASVFGSLANHNVRTVRLLLEEVANVSKLKEFVQKSVKLKYFKLEMPTLALSSVLLWDALAKGESLEQICVGTRSRDTVNLSVIEEYLPQLIPRLRVLHVHADLANNRNKLRESILRLVKQRKGENFHFESDSASNPDETVFPAFFPGRALCCISNSIAKIKPVGWDLL